MRLATPLGRLPVAALAGTGLLLASCTTSAPSAPPPSTQAPTQAAAAPAVAPTTAPAAPTSQPTAADAAAMATPPETTAISTPAPVAEGAPLIEAALSNLSKTLHPYPDAASYTATWVDAATMLWGGGEGSGGLLAFDWNTLAYRPAMARDLPKVSADGKTFTFTLRDDLKWSDGSPVTVDDFQFAYDQASREDNRYVQLDIVQDIATFRAVDKSTIEVTLREAKPHDVALGVANVIGPVPKKIWEGKSWTDTASNPEILTPSVVLGPFKVQEFKIAERGVFVPVDTYPGGKPRVPRVEILANQQPTVAYESLKNGRANWMHPLPAPQYADAKATPDLDVKEWTAANAPYRTLEFNLTRSFLSDKRVREALATAVNRTDLLDLAEQGLAAPQYSFIPPTNQKWVNNTVEHYDFNLDRSRQLLAEAGYQLSRGQLIGKDSQPIKLQVLYPTSSAARAKIAAYLQQQYKELGIEVEVKGLDFNAYTDQVQNRREFDVSLATYGGGSLDPDLGPKAQLIQNGQQNVTGYANARVDELFRQGSVELDDAKRKQLYDQLQAQVAKDLPSHYLYALDSIDVFSRSVQGVVPRRGDRLDYNDALLSWSVAQ
ncbi:MAG TPA: ABC transporter substrate-binding protein [Chloroflexota bacterium]|nr:ABC transporter substrate-binding protein [Chloroflexota bacterium]